MKITNLVFAFNLVATLCFSQTTLIPVTFIIEDFDTHKEIVAALVTVRQTALTQPTLANGKVKFENVPVGEIEYYIMKEGYQFGTGRVNVSSDLKTNNFRIPISKLDDKKILVTGEVSDAEGRDLKDAMVEVKIADQVRTVMSDASGNYSLDIAPSTKFPTSTMRIEVKKGDCKKIETVDIPRTNVVYKDFKLECSSQTNPPNPIKTNEVTNGSKPVSQKYTFEDGDFLFELTECKRQGNIVEFLISITAKKQDLTIDVTSWNTNNKYTHFFDNLGNEYKPSILKISNKTSKTGIIQTLIAKTPSVMTMIFDNTQIDAKTVTLLEVFYKVQHGDKRSLQFRGIEIK